jgi:hypothetical protein
MALFKTAGPIGVLESDLSRLGARQSTLQDRVNVAREAHGAAVSTRHDLLGGDFTDEQVEECDAAVRRAERALAAARDAVALIEPQIAEVEERLVTERDRQARAAEAGRVGALLVEARKATDALLATV